MIWLEFILGGLYTLLIFVGGFLAAHYVLKLKWSKESINPRLVEPRTHLETSQKQQHSSGALKSMTPKERNLEQTKEMRERIEYLLK